MFGKQHLERYRSIWETKGKGRPEGFYDAKTKELGLNLYSNGSQSMPCTPL